MRLASDWAVALDPCRKPLRARDEIFNKAVEQITLVLLEIASDGVKDSSKESVSVVRSDKDLSWIEAAVTKALHSENLRRESRGVKQLFKHDTSLNYNGQINIIDARDKKKREAIILIPDLVSSSERRGI